MGFSLFKKKIVREIQDAAWGTLVNDHHIDVDTLSRDMRCVSREGKLGDNPVIFLRIFRLSETKQKGIEVTGWETFDQHPELVCFEGYETPSNKAFIKRKK